MSIQYVLANTGFLCSRIKYFPMELSSREHTYTMSAGAHSRGEHLEAAAATAAATTAAAAASAVIAFLAY